ncbi:MAG: hypothetical protein K2Y09_05475 [Nitrosomonas sp.]|uniref:hypothetical protein n=1 Tax=Nitrosomonas sp. TaxID=42353 RepID=UPI001D747E85|nr:hypothetical protein [Nitrosomonas sp.]MBX9894616.1 hypothetical protein [Nitrosomonas sp.]
MDIKFEWESELPIEPSADRVQENIKYVLDRLPDPRGLCPSIVSIYLKQDALKLKVVGVGYSKDEKPIVTFHHTLVQPVTYSWDYYENPQRR